MVGESILSTINYFEGGYFPTFPTPDSFITGSEFAQKHQNTNRFEREEDAINLIIAGNIPSFLRTFAAVKSSSGENSITYFVSSDSVSVGTDEDYLRIPLNGTFAQKLVSALNCSLPTTKIVDDVWKQADYQLAPLPHGPPYDASMMSMARIKEHSDKIQNQLQGKEVNKLIAGHKKDLVLTNALYPNNPNQRIAIYGWTQLNGKPIQQLNPKSHELSYSDYSHQVRLVSNTVICNNNVMSLQDVFADSELCKLVSNESVLKFTSY